MFIDLFDADLRNTAYARKMAKQTNVVEAEIEATNPSFSHTFQSLKLIIKELEAM